MAHESRSRPQSASRSGVSVKSVSSLSVSAESVSRLSVSAKSVSSAVTWALDKLQLQ